MVVECAAPGAKATAILEATTRLLHGFEGTSTTKTIVPMSQAHFEAMKPRKQVDRTFLPASTPATPRDIPASSC